MSEAQRIRDQRRAKFLAKYNAKNGAKSNSSFSDSSYSNDFVHNRNGNPNTSNFNNNNQFTNQSNFQPTYQQSNLNQPNPNLQTPVLPKMDNKYNSFAEFEKSNAKISKAFDKINQQKESNDKFSSDEESFEVNVKLEKNTTTSNFKFRINIGEDKELPILSNINLTIFSNPAISAILFRLTTSLRITVL